MGTPIGPVEGQTPDSTQISGSVPAGPVVSDESLEVRIGRYADSCVDSADADYRKYCELLRGYKVKIKEGLTPPVDESIRQAVSYFDAHGLDAGAPAMADVEREIRAMDAEVVRVNGEFRRACESQESRDQCLELGKQLFRLGLERAKLDKRLGRFGDAEAVLKTLIGQQEIVVFAPEVRQEAAEVLAGMYNDSGDAGFRRGNLPEAAIYYGGAAQLHQQIAVPGEGYRAYNGLASVFALQWMQEINMAMAQEKFSPSRQSEFERTTATLAEMIRLNLQTAREIDSGRLATDWPTISSTFGEFDLQLSEFLDQKPGRKPDFLVVQSQLKEIMGFGEKR